MCVVSNTGDFFGDRLPKKFPWVQPGAVPTDRTEPLIPQQQPVDWSKIFFGVAPTKQEFDDLKKEVELMKELLIRAKLYDEQNNEPNCEIDEKIAKLKAIAAIVGISLDDIFIGPAVKLQTIIDNVKKDEGTN